MPRAAPTPVLGTYAARAGGPISGTGGRAAAPGRPDCERRSPAGNTGCGPSRRSGGAPINSEQPGVAALDAAHGVVVERDAADAAILREGAGLRLDLLRGEDALHRRQVRVAVH